MVTRRATPELTPSGRLHTSSWPLMDLRLGHSWPSPSWEAAASPGAAPSRPWVAMQSAVPDGSDQLHGMNN